jgi:hypothetical protein
MFKPGQQCDGKSLKEDERDAVAVHRNQTEQQCDASDHPQTIPCDDDIHGPAHKRLSWSRNDHEQRDGKQAEPGIEEQRLRYLRPAVEKFRIAASNAPIVVQVAASTSKIVRIEFVFGIFKVLSSGCKLGKSPC